MWVLMADDGAKKRDINNQYLAFSLCNFMQTVLMASAAAALEQLWNALVLCLLSLMLYFLHALLCKFATFFYSGPLVFVSKLNDISVHIHLSVIFKALE